MSVKQNNIEGYAAQIAPKDTVSRYQQLKGINLEVLGERLRRARIEKKISQRDLSSGLFTSAYLSSLELGKTRPTLTTLEQLASLLGKSTDYFLRPTSSHSLDDSLDQEQSRALELRQALLSAQVYLEHAADELLWHTLQQISLGLSRLGPSDRARYHYLLGRYYTRLGNTQDAQISLQEAQQLLAQGQGEAGYAYATSSVEPDLAALIEYELGDVNGRSRQSMAALNHYTAGLESLNANSNPTLRWKLLAGAASCYRLLNDPEQAQAYFNKALEQASQNTPEKQADYFYKRASALSEQGDFQRSSLYYGRSMQVYESGWEHEILGETCVSLGQLQVQAKEYAGARQVGELALKLSREREAGVASQGERSRSQEMKALVLLATVHQREGDLKGASSYLEQATRLQQEQAQRQEQGQAGRSGGKGKGEGEGKGESGREELMLEGQYYQVAAELKGEEGERKEAEGYYQKALETLEKLQEESKESGDEGAVARLLAEVYYSYGRRLKEWNETQKSLELMERAYRLSTGKGRNS